MNVILVSCIYPPEHTYSAKTGKDTVEELLAQGHTVRVYAPFPSRPGGEIHPGYKRSLYRSTPLAPGSSLTHCFSFFSRRSTLFSRFAENISFGITSSLAILFGPRADVLYTNSWPIFATGLLTLVARLRRIPLVVRVQDVYPESLLSQQRITRQSAIFRLLRAIDKWIVHSAHSVSVISPTFERLYKGDRGLPPNRVAMVPNWGNDFTAADQSESALGFRERLGIPPDAFVALYAGNVGVAAGAELLVEAMVQLKNERHIHLVIAGAGTQLPACRDIAAQNGLARVAIHTPWENRETLPVLKMADVLLLPTMGAQSLNSIPSKLISYLLTGRPVIASVLPESDTADVIRQSGCGWIVAPDSVEQMASAIRASAQVPTAQREQMGAQGRAYALTNLTRSGNLPRIVEALQSAATAGR